MPATSVDLRVAATPSEDFDGFVTATVVVSGAAEDVTAEGAGVPFRLFVFAVVGAK